MGHACFRERGWEDPNSDRHDGTRMYFEDWAEEIKYSFNVIIMIRLVGTIH